jgi:6-pyruvoyltetrahydropterin/6-carboxytetrahydropterin synthase
MGGYAAALRKAHMFVIAKQYEFSASHQLHQLPDGHKCRRLHGHNYTVEIQLASPQLDDRSFVVDFAELTPVGDWLKERFDHQHLNDVLEVEPSSERLAEVIYVWCSSNLDPKFADVLHAVRVSESGTTWAEYRR